MKKFLIGVIVLIYTSNVCAQTTIKAMSFNIRLDAASDGENRWDLRKNRVADLMQYYEADFIGAQEVLHHQLTYLDSSLVNYSFMALEETMAKHLENILVFFIIKKNLSLLSNQLFGWPLNLIQFVWVGMRFAIVSVPMAYLKIKKPTKWFGCSIHILIMLGK